MWRITTRGFTLQEVLILAAMNIAISTLTSERRGHGTSQNKKERTCNLETS